MFFPLGIHIWVRDERGQGLVSYAVLLMLMVLACVGSLRFFGGTVVAMFHEIQKNWP